MKKIFALSAFFCTMLFVATPAHAVMAPTQLDFTDLNHDSISMEINPGQLPMPANYWGYVDTKKSGNKYDHAEGDLAGFTKIVFQYTLSKPATGQINIHYKDDVGLSVTVDPFTQADTVFTVTIANLKKEAQDFWSYIQLPGFNGTVTTRYDTYAAPMPTPLPAALPLFGAGLAGLAALKLKRSRKRKVVA